MKCISRPWASKLATGSLSVRKALSQVGSVSFDRQGIADHAQNLANTIQGNLKRSLEALGVDILIGNARFVGPNKLSYGLPGRVDIGGEVTAKNIIIATGSVPFVPPGKSPTN